MLFEGEKPESSLFLGIDIGKSGLKWWSQGLLSSGGVSFVGNFGWIRRRMAGFVRVGPGSDGLCGNGGFQG